MCGRFALGLPPKSLAEYFQLDETPELIPRYNIAPTQTIAAIINDKKNTGRVLKMLRWGLIPSWAKDTKMSSKLINARAETVTEKPAFRSAFKNKRCLIPTTGFYEWKRREEKNQPYFITMQNNTPFAFAGLWEHREGNDRTIETCTIITTEPNSLLRNIHNRMPVILKPSDYNLWLDHLNPKRELLASLLIAYPSEQMTYYPIHTYINNPQNDDSLCIEPL